MKKVFKSFFIFCLLCLAILLVVISVSIFKYRSWERYFEDNLHPEYIAEDYDEIPMDLQSRFFEFISSYEKSDFIEISVSEFSDLLLFVSKSSLQGVEIQNLYIEPQEGVWRIYIDAQIGGVDIPWLSFDLIKDDRETAEVYVKNIYLGDVNLTEWLPDRIVNDINGGISEALIQFNENLFSKRYIQNIELSTENAIIKGILY